mmetsp:Transcript_18742/g.33918  ORF Transcript_18742/g.33918 Transcript_18742/m.33918 type:complete len:80 (-) Transcript_18742:575-814(-)
MLKAVGKAWKETIFSIGIFSSQALLQFLDSVSSPCLCDKMESGTFIRDLLVSAHLFIAFVLLVAYYSRPELGPPCRKII